MTSAARTHASVPRKKARGRYHHGDLRRAILDTSIALIEREGVAALTLRGVARALGVSHAAPLHHFADRTELLATIAAEGFDELTRRMQEAIAKEEEPVARLVASGVAYVEYAAADPARFRVMFGRELADGGPEWLRAHGQPPYDLLVEAAERALALTVTPTPERVRTTAISAWSSVHGLATLWVDGRLRDERGRALSAPALCKLARSVTGAVAKGLERAAEKR
jgi:AcrR family transcriptional regulator